MLEKIRFSDRDDLYVLGDAVDRGPELMILLLDIIRLLFPFRYPIKLDTLIFWGYLDQHMHMVWASFCVYDIHTFPVAQPS